MIFDFLSGLLKLVNTTSNPEGVENVCGFILLIVSNLL